MEAFCNFFCFFCFQSLMRFFNFLVLEALKEELLGQRTAEVNFLSMQVGLWGWPWPVVDL